MAISIDTSVILAIGATPTSNNDQHTVNALGRALDRRDTIFYTNTVIIETGLACEKYPELAQNFKDGAEKVTSWYKAKALQITGVANGIADSAADDLLKRCPEGLTLKKHHALYIAEAAVSGSKIRYLMTWDPALLSLKNSWLSIVLEDNQLDAVQIVSPYEYLEYTCNGKVKPES